MSEFELAPCVEPLVIAELHGQCFEEAWGVGAITDILTMPGAYCIVGGEGDEIMGFVLCRAAADESEILSMGVAPGNRRKGLGRSLLLAAIDYLSAMGAKKAFLEVAEDNPNAQAFYKKFGFEKVGRRRRYYKRKSGDRVDALILAHKIKRLPCE